MLLILITIALVVAQFALPLRYGFLPLLIAVFHLGNITIVSEFTPCRLLILTGLARAFATGAFRWSTANRVDAFVGLFGVIALLSSLGHEPNEYVPSPFIERAGLVLNVVGSYLYGRAFCSNRGFLPDFSRLLLWVLVPLSLMLAAEQTTGHNFYDALGSRTSMAGVRNDRFRAQGPFGHAIIAGTAAAAALPFMMMLRRRRRMAGNIGIAASVIGTMASASSGPLVAIMAAFAMMWFWRWRHLLGKLKVFTGLLLLFLNFTMSRPIWFLIARIDLVGGSTGWHRSKLIDMAMGDIGSWWLAGTDFTRHWMHSGVAWNPNHTDITNYYLLFGVIGGLPLMLTFLAIIVAALMGLERMMHQLQGEDEDSEYSLWCLWAAILTHCLSFISIAYFDQSVSLFFLLIAAAAAVRDASWSEEEREGDTDPEMSGREESDPNVRSRFHQTSFCLPDGRVPAR